MSFFDKAKKVFHLDENTKLRPYKDSKGYWTIGRGHLIGEQLTDLSLSLYIVDELFKEDLAIAIQDARRCVGSVAWDGMSEARQMATVSMLFTLGANKFLKFDETIEHIKAGEWNDVAEHILDAKWARDVDPRQVPGEGRDDRVAYMFKTGCFHPIYKV